jgi:hypothetical protein
MILMKQIHTAERVAHGSLFSETESTVKAMKGNEYSGVHTT